MSGAVTRFLPTRVARVQILSGDSPSVSVAGVGEISLQPVKTEDGKQAKLVNAPLLAVFGFESEDLASSSGSRWDDPDMRRWEAGGAGGITPFNWRA